MASSALLLTIDKSEAGCENVELSVGGITCYAREAIYYRPKVVCLETEKT